MMLKRLPSKALLGDTLASLLVDLVMHHLPLARDIYFFFAREPRSPGPVLLDDGQRCRVLKSMRETLVNTYCSGSGKQILRAMHSGSALVFEYLCVGASLVSDSNAPADGWDGVGVALLEAAEQNPAIGVPLILPFITFVTSNRARGHSSDTAATQLPYTFAADAAKMRSLFDFNRLARVLRDYQPPDDLDPMIRERYEAAKSALKE